VSIQRSCMIFNAAGSAGGWADDLKSTTAARALCSTAN
jgi:hypothetical protein